MPISDDSGYLRRSACHEDCHSRYMGKAAALLETRCNAAVSYVSYGNHIFCAFGFKPVHDNKKQAFGKGLRPGTRLSLKGIRTFVQKNVSDTNIQKIPRTYAK